MCGDKVSLNFYFFYFQTKTLKAIKDTRAISSTLKAVKDTPAISSTEIVKTFLCFKLHPISYFRITISKMFYFV